MNYLIGVSGKAGHGKDSVVSFLKQCLVEDYGSGNVEYVDIKFADKLKEITADLLDVLPWYMNDQAGKETGIEHMGGITGRRALQIIGTDVARSIYQDVWVYHYMDKVTDYFASIVTIPDSVFVFTSDVRFKNEYDAVKKYEGSLNVKPILIRVVRPGFNIGHGVNHLSETQLDDVNDWDYKLVAEDLTELGKMTREVYKSIVE